MRVVVYDEAGEIALDYDTRSDTLSLCPGRLEKALVVEALHLCPGRLEKALVVEALQRPRSL